jgi:alkylhydroperoxidase family enzyme
VRFGPIEVCGFVNKRVLARGRWHYIGFEDRAILQITLTASWFNYINRVTDALGVSCEGESCE